MALSGEDIKRIIGTVPVESESEGNNLVKMLIEQNKILLETMKCMNKTNFNTMPDFLKSVNEFDGRSETEANAWLNNVNEMAELHQCSETCTFQAIKVKMIGPAKHWFKSRKFENWEDFVFQFKRTFCQQATVSDRWKRLHARRQQKNEMLEDYFYEKISLCEDLNLGFMEIKELILEGLYSRDLVKYLMACQHTDTDHIMYDIRRYEGINVNFDKTKDDKRSCYKCGQEGHHAIKCTRENNEIRDEKKCYNCNEKGHIKAKCPKLRDRRQIQEINTDCIDNVGIHKYLKIVAFNNIVFSAMIDTGSAVCCITENAAKRSKLNLIDAEMLLYSYGDNENPTVTSRKQVKGQISIDDISVEIIACVVPDSTQKMDILVGRTFTDNPQVAYIKRDDKLYFGDREDPIFTNMNLEEKLTKVVTVEDTIIEAEKVTQGKATIANVSVTIPIVNSGENDSIIKQDTKIGKILEETEEISKTLDTADINVEDNEIIEESKVELNLSKNDRLCSATSLEEYGYSDTCLMNIEATSQPMRSKHELIQNERLKDIRYNIEKEQKCYDKKRLQANTLKIEDKDYDDKYLGEDDGKDYYEMNEEDVVQEHNKSGWPNVRNGNSIGHQLDNQPYKTEQEVDNEGMDRTNREEVRKR